MSCNLLSAIVTPAGTSFSGSLSPSILPDWRLFWSCGPRLKCKICQSHTTRHSLHNRIAICHFVGSFYRCTERVSVKWRKRDVVRRHVADHCWRLYLESVVGKPSLPSSTKLEGLLFLSIRSFLSVQVWLQCYAPSVSPVWRSVRVPISLLTALLPSFKPPPGEPPVDPTLCYNTLVYVYAKASFLSLPAYFITPFLLSLAFAPSLFFFICF